MRQISRLPAADVEVMEHRERAVEWVLQTHLLTGPKRWVYDQGERRAPQSADR